MAAVELYRKPLLKIGEKYHAPAAVLDATIPNRAKHWVDAFRKMKAAGFKIPVPYGHRLSAMPRPEECTDEEWRDACEQREFEETYWNAGYLEDLFIDHQPTGDFLVASMPIPPGFAYCPKRKSLINESNGTELAEMSGAWGDYRDGNGKTWNDILCHVALCTKPVYHNQPPFEAHRPTTLSTKVGSVAYSFTASLARGMQMAKRKPEDDTMRDDEEIYTPDDEETDIDPPVDDETPEEESTVDEPAETPTEEVVETPVETPVAEVPSMGDEDYCHQAVSLLAEMGFALPPKTDCKNFFERFVTALTVAKSFGGKFQRQEPPDENAPPPSAATSGMDAGAPPTAEPPPIMMSTRDPRLPEAVRKSYAREERNVRREVKEICGKLKQMGVPVWKCDELGAGSNLITLSLTSGGDIRMPKKLGQLRVVLGAVEAMRGRRTEKKPVTPVTLSNRQKPTPEQNPAAMAKAVRDNGDKPPEDMMAAMKRAAASEAGVAQATK